MLLPRRQYRPPDGRTTEATRSARVSRTSRKEATIACRQLSSRRSLQGSGLIPVPSWAGGSSRTDTGPDAFRLSDESVFEALGLARTSREVLSP
jgi:gentisate 1,2-dioxygenase